VLSDAYYPTLAKCVTCFQIKRDTGLWFSAEYASFSVGSEADKYRLSVSGYSGDAGDALAAPVISYRIANGMKFTTPDQDNDEDPGQCGGRVTAWWFNKCARSLLNIDMDGIWNAVTDESITDIMDARMMVKLD